MPREAIQARVDEETAARLDALVEADVFDNTSQATRELLADALEDRDDPRDAPDDGDAPERQPVAPDGGTADEPEVDVTPARPTLAGVHSGARTLWSGVVEATFLVARALTPEAPALAAAAWLVYTGPASFPGDAQLWAGAVVGLTVLPFLNLLRS